MLDDIVLFLRIVELGSFKKAADFSRLSLSTVSKRISALEYQLNHKLMLRDAKSIILTEYGKVVYAKFQNLLIFSSKIENVNNSFKIQESKINDCVTLYLGANIANNLVNPHLWSFLKSNPTLMLNIIYQINPDSVNGINSNIMLTTNFLKIEGYTARLLRNEHFQFYCSSNYARLYGVPQSIAELGKRELIGGISEENQSVNNILMRNLLTNERAALSLEHTQLKINNPVVMRNIGINCDVIFPCWTSLCKNDLLNGKIVRILPEWTIYTNQIYLITKNNPSPAEELVINFLVECCSEKVIASESEGF